jgi:hypothetical protein
VAEVTAPEFLRCARRRESRGAIESAHRMLQNCGQVMRYAIATGRAGRNPVTHLRGALSTPPERPLGPGDCGRMCAAGAWGLSAGQVRKAVARVR